MNQSSCCLAKLIDLSGLFFRYCLRVQQERWRSRKLTFLFVLPGLQGVLKCLKEQLILFNAICDHLRGTVHCIFWIMDIIMPDSTMISYITLLELSFAGKPHNIRKLLLLCPGLMSVLCFYGQSKYILVVGSRPPHQLAQELLHLPGLLSSLSDTVRNSSIKCILNHKTNMFIKAKHLPVSHVITGFPSLFPLVKAEIWLWLLVRTWNI